MSGIAALVVATALQWRYITPTEGTLDPRLWWTIAAICFVAAMFLAWLDEYRKRRSAETSGPKLVLEHIPENQPHHPPLWRITNSGETDALNIDSDELQSYGTSARIIGIQRLHSCANGRLALERLHEPLERSGLHDEPWRYGDARALQLAETSTFAAHLRPVVEPNVREPCGNLCRAHRHAC